MTLAEFKAWFDGYTESIDDAPTEKQWKRIKARVKEIDGAAVTERVYVDRYVPQYWPTYVPRPGYYPYQGPFYTNMQSATLLAAQSGAGIGNQTTGIGASSCNAVQTAPFNSLTAMNALGRAEAQGSA